MWRPHKRKRSSAVSVGSTERAASLFCLLVFDTIWLGKQGFVMVDLVRDALGMFYSLNGLVKSDTSMSLLGTPRGRDHGTGEVV